MAAQLIGVDFDNTIVRYDDLFWRLAREEGLIPESVPPTKTAVRDFLRAADREDAWTRLQGLAYGSRMDEAEAFPGALEFFGFCFQRGFAVTIISHKTRLPYRGDKHDLQRAARRWLQVHGFHDRGRAGLAASDVFFELTKEAKLLRIHQLRCSHFIDDLPEFLSEPGFPADVERILFDPHRLHGGEKRFQRVESWSAIQEIVACSSPA